MPQRISSAFTFFYRLVLPLLWIGLFGTALGALLLRPEVETRSKLMFVAAWTYGAVFAVWYAARLRSVFLLSDALLVSNFGRQRRIPLDRVVAVDQPRWSSPGMIRVRVREASGRVETVRFLPPTGIFPSFREHRVVGELRNRVEAAYGGALARAAASPSHRSVR